MVLSFALCASFAFAQTNSTVMDRSQVARAAERATVVDDASYSGSIFTKEGEVFTCTFESEPGNLYTVGVVGANEMVGGTIIPEHTQQSYHSSWHRIPDTSMSTYNALIAAGNYPASYGTDPYSYATFCANTRGSANANDGYMYMTMQDQIAAWNGTGYTGNFDAWIRFASFSTTNHGLVYVRFFQNGRRFNNDQFWIDYSTDGGSTWNALEYNVKVVDVAVNSGFNGYKKITLPLSCGNKANVDVRIRWSCDNNAGGAYGYYNIVDDFRVYPAPANTWTIKTNMYYEGFYQLLPQGLQVPVAWNTDFINDGLNAQTNVTGTIYTMADGQAATPLVSATLPSVASDPMVTTSLAIDAMGIYGAEGWGFSPMHSTGDTTYACLPTTNTGLHHFFGNLSSDNISHAYLNSNQTYDTMAYTVNFGTRNGNACGVWGRDHGTVRKFSYWLAGMVGPNTFSTTPSSIMWSDAGYGVLVSYAVGNNIPNNWKILGVEMVPSTYEGYRQSGAKLNALLYKQTNYDSADDNYRSLAEVTTGAGTYTVQNSDLISGVDFQDLEYSTFGNYPTVFIPFPEQPALEAGVQYRVGYQLAEEAQFAVAANSYFYYSSDDSTGVRFADDPNTQAFAHSNPLDNRFQVMVIDPYDNGAHYFSMDEWPMIRLVVGPGFYVPKYAFSFECNAGGMIYDEEYNELCGTTDSITEGATRTFIILPEEGYHLQSLVVNGTAVEPEAVMTEDDNGNTVLDYYTYTVSNVHSAYNFVLTYAVDIDFVEGVSLKLQPNPATSNVQLTLNGVSGMVNMSLIDMSGRVISTSNFNAENGANINVSNLAKGAYFVRITNDKFSKVEKLIVR